MIGLVLGNSFLLILVVIELAILRFLRKEKIPWAEIVMNLNSGHILMWIFRGFEIYAYYKVNQYFSLQIFQILPTWAQWILGYLMWDFCFYWLHRLHHKIALFWHIHVVHHQGEHFSLSLGIRNSWYSSLSSFPFFVGLAILGLPVDIFIGVSSINYFMQFYNHNRLVKKSGWLEYFMVTPAHHRVHHGKNEVYIDKNFGGTFIIWDKLFGTFQKELPDEPIQFGIAHNPSSVNIFWLNNVSFWEAIKGKTSPEKPVQSTNRETVSPFFISLGCCILFCLLLYFVFIEHEWQGWDKHALFSLIFIASVSNGLLFENRPSSVLLWFLVAFVGAIGLWFTLSHQHFILNTLLCLLAFHGVWTLFSWHKKNKAWKISLSQERVRL